MYWSLVPLNNASVLLSVPCGFDCSSVVQLKLGRIITPTILLLIGIVLAMLCKCLYLHAYMHVSLCVCVCVCVCVYLFHMKLRIFL